MLGLNYSNEEHMLRNTKNALFLGAMAFGLSSCGMFSDEPTTVKAQDLIQVNVKVAPCAATSSEASANATKLLEASLNNMQQAMVDGSWGNVQNSAPTQALDAYNQILAQDAGNCEAQFGKAVATLASLVNNPSLDSMITEVKNHSTSTTASDVESYSAYLNLKSEAVPAALFKLSQTTANTTNPMTVDRMQNIVIAEFLPKLDTAIAMLDNVMQEEEFSIELTINPGKTNEKLVQLDKGEVGPSLAVLKTIKAYLVTFVSVNLDATLDGKYEWVDVLKEIKSEDFDSLTSVQTAALDHAVGLTKKSSLVTTIKKEWQSKYAGIPALLKSAIQDIRSGMEYGIFEAENGGDQLNDPYIVGSGINAHVNEAKMREYITHLDRLDKYLDGDVTLKYNKGKDSIVVNFPKSYTHFSGTQDFLPYHVVRPYAEWNDFTGERAVWNNYSSYCWMGGTKEDSLLIAQAGEVIYGDASSLSICENDGWIGTMFAYNVKGDTVVISLDDFTCSATFTSNSGKEVVADFSQCRMTNNKPEWIEYYTTDRKLPYYFTDAKGKPTFGENIFVELNSLTQTEAGIASLNGKIVFPDPTFGGVFPNMTNSNIWSVIKSLNTVKARVMCKDSEDYGLEYGECWSSDRILPTNPSDLDVLNYYLSL